MENESKKESEKDESAPRRHRKADLNLHPKHLLRMPQILSLKRQEFLFSLTHYVLNENYGRLYREPHEESMAAAIDKELMLRLRILKTTNALGSRANSEKQETPFQVAFGQADPSVLRTFSTPRSSSSAVPAAKLPKKHDDQWDYTSTNYPVTLPLLRRRPYSGDPDLDEDEFRQSSSKLTAAEELGLMDRMDEPQLLFFQLPRSLPLQRQADPVTEADTGTSADVNAKSEGGNRKRRHYPVHGCKLKELPGGLMGKILVYKSGKVKMKLGDAHFDVSAGSNCSFAQEAVAVDTREKHCSSLGEVGKLAIVTPDIDYLLGCIKME